jgi:hypothetical protein
MIRKKNGYIVVAVVFVCIIFYSFCSYRNDWLQEKNLISVVFRGNQVVAAIGEFHKQKGYFPQTLSSLIPEYIEAIPRIESAFFEPTIKYELMESGYRLVIVPKQQPILLISQEINWLMYTSTPHYYANDHLRIHTHLQGWYCITKYRR